MDNATEKSVRLPTFDGTSKSYQFWWTRFQAYATVYEFGEALVVGGEADLPGAESTVLDETTADGKLNARPLERLAFELPA
jgi:hypothetical protein